MNSSEFYLLLNGYLEALETEGIEKIKIANIREKMKSVNTHKQQERVVFGPNVKPNNPQPSNTHYMAKKQLEDRLNRDESSF